VTPIPPLALYLSQVSVCRLIPALVGRECDNAVEATRQHCATTTMKSDAVGTFLAHY